jgi:hypothetical protein
VFRSVGFRPETAGRCHQSVQKDALVAVIEMTNTLSDIGDVIRRYKARANDEGAAAWANVPCAPDIQMHIPKFEIEAVGAEEIDAKVFGLIASAGIRQELVEIREFGRYVTCFLRQTDGENNWDAVEVFLFNEHDQVTEIWTL